MDLFREPGRPTVAEIDLAAMAFNYHQIQKRIPRGVGILGVVKADAYGHGAIRVALKLEELGVQYLGVAISDEGVELRKGGIRAPILVLGGVFLGEVDQFLKYDLTPVVFHRKSLRLLSNAAERRRKRLKVHLKVDTGMRRLGVPFDQWGAFLHDLKRFPNLEVEGVLSHFSMTDEEDVAFTEGQWEEFRVAVNMAKEMGIPCRYVHIANSANLAAFPAYSGNLVRPGIILYGSYPSRSSHDLIPLKPVMALKTRIYFLKWVPPGARISYGGAFTARRESLVATLPIGYADGYNRLLSNRGEVLVRGQRAPLVGKVCMDYVMADVTNVPKVAIGDEVVLIGRQGRERITAEEIAEKVGTVSYEVLCGVGKRVPRTYKE